MNAEQDIYSLDFQLNSIIRILCIYYTYFVAVVSLLFS